jgi:hypothetical protein
VFIGISSESLPATNQRAAYVAITRGKEMVQLFTDDKEELLQAMCRPDEPMSATGLVESANRSSSRTGRPTKPLTTAQELAAVARHWHARQQNGAGRGTSEREVDHDR